MDEKRGTMPKHCTSLMAEMVGFEPGFLQFAKKDGSKEGPINCQKQEVVCNVKNIDTPKDQKLVGSFVGTNWPVFLEI